MLIFNRPSWTEKIGYLLGAIGKDTVYMLISAFYLLYLYQELKLSLTFITVAFFSIRIFDACSDIFIGYFFDRFHSRYGKFKPALLLGGFLSAILTIMMFNPPALQGYSLYAYFIITYILWTISYSIHDIAFWGLIPTFGSDSKTRETMTIIPRSGALIGAQAVLLLGLPFLYYLKNDLHLYSNYFGIFAGLLASFYFISTIITVFSIKDRTINYEHKKISLRLLGEIIFHNDQLIVIALLSFFQQLIISIVNSSIFLFLFSKPHGTELLSDYILPSIIAQLLAYICFKPSCHIFSRRFVIICSCVLMAIGYTVMFFSEPQNDHIINLFTLSYGLSCFGMAWSIASTTVMSADCVDYGEFKHNIRTEGIVFAFQTASAKFSLAVAIAISGFSFNIESILLSQLQKQSYIFSIRFTLVIVFLLSIAMIVIYLSSYRLHGHFFQNILNSIELFRTQSSNYLKKSSTFPLRYALDSEAVICNLKADSIDEVLSLMASRLYKISAISSKSEYLKRIKEKMAETPAGIADGIAIPHVRGDGIKRMAIAIATLEKPLDFGAPDGKKCDLIFMLASPDDHVSHLNLLGQLSIILNIPGFADKLRSAGSSLEITDRILKCEKQLKS